MVFDTIFDGLVLLFGIGMVLHAGSILYHLSILLRLGRTDTGAIDKPGLVSVEGTIQKPLAEPLESPFQRKSGCLAKWTVKEYTGHDLQVGGGWTDFGTGYEAVPFIIDDGSGPVAIDITGDEQLRVLELELPDYDDDPIYEQDVAETPPDHITEFLNEYEAEIRDHQGETRVPTTKSGDEQGDRRYYEQVLQSGDRIYVAGFAEVTENPDPDDVPATIIASPDKELFYLSDREQKAAWKRRLARIGVTGCLGLALTWYGVAQFLPSVSFPL